MEHKEIELDGLEVGRVLWEVGMLPASIRSAGGAHDTEQPRITVVDLYNLTVPGNVGYSKEKFANRPPAKGVGQALLFFPAEAARKAEDPYIYVVGAKRQAWDFYRGIGFWPVGLNLRSWCMKTEKLWRKVETAKAMWAGMPANQDVARRPANAFVTYLSGLPIEPGNNPEIDDPKNWKPKTGEVFTGRKMVETASGGYAPKQKWAPGGAASFKDDSNCLHSQAVSS